MSSIIERFVEESTRQQRNVYPPLLAINYQEKPTGDDQIVGFSREQEYELILKLGIRYWGSDINKRQRKQTAERALAHHIYADMSGRLECAMHAIANRDWDNAMRLISDVVADMRGNK